MFNRWYRQKVSARSQASSAPRPTKARRQRRCRPQLERLEQTGAPARRFVKKTVLPLFENRPARRYYRRTFAEPRASKPRIPGPPCEE